MGQSNASTLFSPPFFVGVLIKAKSATVLGNRRRERVYPRNKSNERSGFGIVQLNTKAEPIHLKLKAE